MVFNIQEDPKERRKVVPRPVGFSSQTTGAWRESSWRWRREIEILKRGLLVH